MITVEKHYVTPPHEISPSLHWFEMNTCTCHTLLSCRPHRYGEDFTLHDCSEHAHTSISSTLPIGHMQAHVWTFALSIPPIAVQCAGPSWQPLWGSPNIAMAYVHTNCGEWRSILHHFAPCGWQTPLNRAIERGNNTAARVLDTLKHTVVLLYGVPQERKNRGL